MAEVKLLTAGAFKRVALSVVSAFERETGHKVTVANDTAGALVRRIRGGEVFDVVVVSLAAIETLTAEGSVAAGACTPLAKVAIGVMVKAGAAKPDVSTVAAFRQAVLNAGSIGYIDPQSGGSSGAYVADLLERLGIAAKVKGRIRLKQGGHVSDLVLSGDVELGIHQMSEIVSTEGIALAGPLPSEIQNYTTYAAGIGTMARDRIVAEALVSALASPAVAAMLSSLGMLRP
jgi:molybdate transport system substrate-binding protein